MSQMPSASRPASRSPPDGRNITLPPVQIQDDGQQGGRQGESQRMQQEFEGQTTLRNLQQTEPPQFVQASQTSTSGEEQRSGGLSRGLGVHNILNPAESEHPGSSTPRLGGGGVPQSPSLGGQSHPYATTSSAFSQGYVSQQNVASSSPTESPGTASSRGRKVLIPRSPRAVSLGGRPTPAIGSRQAPFQSPRGRIYTAEPGSGPSSDVPPMPMPVGPQHQTYNLPPSASTPSLARRASMAAMSAPNRAPLSNSASPSPSMRSPYSGPSQLSPAPRHQLGQHPESASYFPGPSYGAPIQQGEVSSQTGPPGTEGPYMTSLPESIFHRGTQSGGQNPNIRFMPISTEHGPMYVPVDVQAASKMADEKRARNAGASARFRERRKQKEKEASMNIQKLEQQLRELERRLRDAEHDRDFYRSERDRFRDVCFRNSSTRELAMQAPLSPRLNRQTSFPPPPPGSMYPPSDAGISPDVERPSRRRRTDEYVFNVAPTSSIPPYQGPSYGTGPGPAPAQAQTNLPPLRMPNVAAPGVRGPPAATNPPLPTTRPQSYEQYPRSGYERGWPGDGGGGQRQ